MLDVETVESLITRLDLGNLISFGPTNVVTIYDTLLIIPEMDALDIPKAFTVFL